MNWNVLVVVGILVMVVLGFWFISEMTGGVVTGVDDKVVVNEYFKVDNKTNETEKLNGTQNSTEPKVPYK